MKLLPPLDRYAPMTKILLAAGTGDMVNSRGLRGHLAVQVDIHGAVDGDEVVDLRHPGNVVHIADRSSHALRVVVDEVIQLLHRDTQLGIFPGFQSWPWSGY